MINNLSLCPNRTLQLLVMMTASNWNNYCELSCTYCNASLMLLNTLKITPQTVCISLNTTGCSSTPAYKQTPSVCVITAIVTNGRCNLSDMSPYTTKQEEQPSDTVVLSFSLQTQFRSEIHRVSKSGFNVHVCRYVWIRVFVSFIHILIKCLERFSKSYTHLRREHQ